MTRSSSERYQRSYLTAKQRRGRIDEIANLETLDLIKFNNGANPYGNDFIEGGFKGGAARHREVVSQWGFDNLGSVADVGSGFGRWSAFLAETNEQVVGFERNGDANALAAKLCAHFELQNACFETCDAGRLTAADGSFDGVWCNNAMQFFDRREAMNEIRRILKPGGRLFLGQYNSIARALEKFIDGYKKSGIGSPVARRILTALKGGPYFNGAGNYADPDRMEEVLLQFGFTLASDPPIEFQMKGGKRAYSSLGVPGLLKDISAFAARLESDPSFADVFVQTSEDAYAYPINLQLLAIRI